MNQVVTASQRPKSRFAAAGSLIAAVLASSCCIGPLLLVTLGVSGAWIGNLTALEPYQPIFVLITFVFLALGFWQVYFRPAQVCKDDEACARPITVRKAMQRVDGVKEVAVDFDTKTATVLYDSNLTDAKQIGDASTNVGFPATLIVDGAE